MRPPVYIFSTHRGFLALCNPYIDEKFSNFLIYFVFPFVTMLAHRSLTRLETILSTSTTSGLLPECKQGVIDKFSTLKISTYGRLNPSGRSWRYVDMYKVNLLKCRRARIVDGRMIAHLGSSNFLFAVPRQSTYPKK